MTELTKDEWDVLGALEMGYNSELAYSFAQVSANIDLDCNVVASACRKLRGLGYAEYTRGLMTEDGECAGSGYSCTDAGRHAYWNRENDYD